MDDGKGIIGIVAGTVNGPVKQRGLSHEELAFEADLDRTYISQVERGKRNVTIVVLARIARALKTTPDRLLIPPRKPRV
jgi:transcriptional regulator with XRE-family HTH domain